MGATERWAYLKDHTVIMHSENPDRLVWLIIAQLRAYHAAKHATENWQTIGDAARGEALTKAEDYCNERLKRLIDEMNNIYRLFVNRPLTKC